jgi:phosphate-selective porin
VTTVIPAAPEPTAQKQPADKTDKKTTDRNQFLTWETHIHLGWLLENEPQDGESNITNEFAIKRARLKLIAEPLDWLKGVIQVDAADALKQNFVKDAYIHLSPLRAVQLRAGQFKKPFSELRLTAADKLRLIERGEGNEAIVKDLRYGDRDLGLQLSGRVLEGIKLDYFVGVFNGNGPNMGDTSNSKDVVFRIEANPAKRLKIGANGSVKFIDNPDTDLGQPEVAQAWGGDAAFRLKGFRVFAQGLLAEDHTMFRYTTDAAPGNPPWIFNVVGIASYQHEFNTREKFAVEPAFQFELVDPQLNVVDDTVLVYTAGLNTYISRFFRIMLNAQFIRTSRNTLPSHYNESDRLEVLLCLDI